MNIEFVPYEQSLELKELGFDEPCLGVYYESTTFYIYTKSKGVKNSDKTSQSWVFTAPLYQQSFRWFREKYNLKSWVQEHTTDTFIYEIRPHKLSDYKEGEIYTYKTYQETELACLKKLIEIVKNK